MSISPQYCSGYLGIHRTISRGHSRPFPHTRILVNGQLGAYPLLDTIPVRASRALDDNEATFKDLYLEDLIWAQAIAADQRLLNPMSEKVMKPLVELLRRGIYDREDDEISNESEERAMRYSAACDTLLLEYCNGLTAKVRLAFALDVWTIALTKL